MGFSEFRQSILLDLIVALSILHNNIWQATYMALWQQLIQLIYKGGFFKDWHKLQVWYMHKAKQWDIYLRWLFALPVG